MQKMQNTWKVKAKRLTEALRNSPHSHKKLAEEAEVDYHAVRRMRRAGVTNQSENARTLCKFFGICDENQPNPMSASALAAAVVETWDGTQEHARLLLELARCTKDYQAIARQ